MRRRPPAGRSWSACVSAVHEAFYDPVNERYVLDEQSYYLMPLVTGVVPEALRPRMLEKLEECIRITRKGHLDTGMLGTYFLLQYLQEIGRNDLLFEIVNQTTYPGWGHMLEQGATTWWEQWNGHWSQIHSCFTSLDGWFYQGLAGIRPDPSAPGFKKIIIKPAILALSGAEGVGELGSSARQVSRGSNAITIPCMAAS
jgi:alpha-L-rhamnosidase